MEKDHHLVKKEQSVPGLIFGESSRNFVFTISSCPPNFWVHLSFECTINRQIKRSRSSELSTLSYDFKHYSKTG